MSQQSPAKAAGRTNTYALNQDQEKAAQAIFQFLLSPDKEFSLSGPAGTGKTFLMHHIMQTLLPDYKDVCRLLGIRPIPFEIALTATTNKATEVLAQSTGYVAQTIHSFMNLKVTDDYRTGVSKITQTNNWVVHTQKLIFIDEASMVDKALYDFLQKGTDKTCKIIYLGDRSQMAPVLEKLSPVYRNQKNTAELLIPVRNAGQPALMELCNQLRRNVDVQDFLPIEPVPGVIDYLDDTQASHFINTTFARETSAARVLCYTNNRVNEYNEYIRNLRGYPKHFVPGERVINATGTQINPQTLLRVEEEFIVEECSSNTEVLKFADDTAEMDVYTVRIKNHKRGSLVIKIPANPDHYKKLMKHFAGQKNWSVYYWLKNNFADLRPKDAATVYKAQGSTYETVFLDLGNIGKCTDNDQVARMLYVGASRATTRLVLYGQLPPRLQNLAA